MWSLYEIIHIWTAVVDESEEWSSQLIFQFKQLERRSLKKSGLQRDSNPWPPRYRCDALPTELWSHTLGARSIIEFISSREEWNDLKFIWNNSYMNCGCRWKWRMIIAVNFPEFKLLLSNCLNWKINCDDHSSLSSTTAVHIWIISYKLNIISNIFKNYRVIVWVRCTLSHESTVEVQFVMFTDCTKHASAGALIHRQQRN